LFRKCTHFYQHLRSIKCAEITSTTQENTEKNSNTKWYATATAILVLEEGYNELKNVLLDIAAAQNEKLLAKFEANF
jgi:hypothetical protein